MGKLLRMLQKAVNGYFLALQVVPELLGGPTGLDLPIVWQRLNLRL